MLVVVLQLYLLLVLDLLEASIFGPSKDSIAIWVKQATPVMIKGQLKTLKDVKQLEKRLAILEEENEILKLAAILLAKK
uniref:hypothetical protein n=1 Tax=Leuconostoc pseudomesenteroides TaxID=33968 RepID=UPI003F563D58